MDKYSKKGRELAQWATGGVSHFCGSGVEVQDAWAKAFAKALREAAAEAYITVAESIDECATMDGPNLSPLSRGLREKAKALREAK